MIEYLKFGFTIIVTILGTLFSSYKYFRREMDKKANKDNVIESFQDLFVEVEKKVDKILYEKDIGFLKKQINESNKSLYHKLEEMRDDMKIVKECLLNK
ncbi:hypothetical protein [Fusobacterium sp. MFO224]|uniref:hypothetical protein n=1 Tax=Fusobacterium sp. MFO224 TaxID=3378070 RepID=UPI003854297A